MTVLFLRAHFFRDPENKSMEDFNPRSLLKPTFSQYSKNTFESSTRVLRCIYIYVCIYSATYIHKCLPKRYPVLFIYPEFLSLGFRFRWLSICYYIIEETLLMSVRQFPPFCLPSFPVLKISGFDSRLLVTTDINILFTRRPKILQNPIDFFFI